MDAPPARAHPLCPSRPRPPALQHPVRGHLQLPVHSAPDRRAAHSLLQVRGVEEDVLGRVHPSTTGDWLFLNRRTLECLHWPCQPRRHQRHMHADTGRAAKLRPFVRSCQTPPAPCPRRQGARRGHVPRTALCPGAASRRGALPHRPGKQGASALCRRAAVPPALPCLGLGPRGGGRALVTSKLAWMARHATSLGPPVPPTCRPWSIRPSCTGEPGSGCGGRQGGTSQRLEGGLCCTACWVG